MTRADPATSHSTRPADDPAGSELGVARFEAGLHSRLSRLAAALFVALSRGSLPAIFLAFLLASNPPLTTPDLLRLVLAFAAAPALGAWILQRAASARVAVGTDVIVVQRRGLRIEVPSDSVQGVEPWIIPLPAPGLAFRLKSGRLLGWGLALEDPLPLSIALARSGHPTRPVSPTSHPLLAWATARVPGRRRRWRRRLGKFGLFALPFAAVVFNLNQHIAFGGAFGQYHRQGLGPYLAAFALTWATAAFYLLLYASFWRAPTEAAAFLGAWAAPSQAARVRRIAEIACGVAYYAGAPLLLALRFIH